MPDEELLAGPPPRLPVLEEPHRLGQPAGIERERLPPAAGIEHGSARALPLDPGHELTQAADLRREREGAGEDQDIASAERLDAGMGAAVLGTAFADGEPREADGRGALGHGDGAQARAEAGGRQGR
ncbi:MAG: hypothetical protein AAFZ09_11030, partial [Pseudomonadota bacterium]